MLKYYLGVKCFATIFSLQNFVSYSAYGTEILVATAGEFCEFQEDAHDYFVYITVTRIAISSRFNYIASYVLVFHEHATALQME